MFMKRFFTQDEQKYLERRPHPVKHLAARFAAKEAVFKVLGKGLGAIAWTDVEILSLPGGAPWVRLSGRARTLAQKMGIGEIAVSLSHCRDYAVAQAVCCQKNCSKDSKD
jgi:holo-[acyl-carrier protein] synthase